MKAKLFKLLIVIILYILKINSICVDDPSANCEQLVGKCLDPNYVPLLQKYCNQTCHYCDTSSPATQATAPPCVDCSPNCQTWAQNGFCSNSFYPDEEKAKYCAFTCHLCPTLPPPPLVTTTIKVATSKRTQAASSKQTQAASSKRTTQAVTSAKVTTLTQTTQITTVLTGCPGNQPTLGPCLMGLCPSADYTCVNDSYCCPVK